MSFNSRLFLFRTGFILLFDFFDFDHLHQVGTPLPPDQSLREAYMYQEMSTAPDSLCLVQGIIRD